jgi:hypothetical protein
MRVKFSEGLRQYLPVSATQGGMFYYCTDSQQLFRSHTDLSIHEITNIIICDTEAIKNALSNKITNKFYYVIETTALYIYTGSQFIQINSAINGFYTNLQIDDMLGDLDNLLTLEKGSIVGAINECVNRINDMDGGVF